MTPVDSVSVSLSQPGGIFVFAHDDPVLRAVVTRGGSSRGWQCQIIYGDFESGQSTMSRHWTRMGALAEVERVFEGHEIDIVDKLRMTWADARLRKR